MKTIKEIYFEAKSRLSDAGIEDSAFDAAVLVEKHTGLRRHEIVLRGNNTVRCDISAFWTDVERRINREPLQYIVGKWSFYGLDFFVGEGVLIPRPDTEILCETAIQFLEGKKNPKLLELCAGSGCLSTAVAKNVENCGLCCVELSDAALVFLKKNLELNGILEQANVIKADVLKAETASLLASGFGAKNDDAYVDAIVCNPPYIKSGDIATLEPEVAVFEPRLALDGGEDGLTFYRAAKNYLPLLRFGGMAAFEVGMGQSDDVAELLKSFGLHDVFVKKDYAGIDRVVGGYN